jgi:hypothetical protein
VRRPPMKWSVIADSLRHADVGKRDAFTLSPRLLALHGDETAAAATSRKPSLLVSYLQTCLGRLEPRLRGLRIAISVSISTAVLFARTKRRI